jgi:hypothetical protein
MIYVTSEVLSARSVDRPTAVDLAEIAVASGLKFIGLLGRKLAAFVFDNESSLLDRLSQKGPGRCENGQYGKPSCWSYEVT